MLETNQRIHPSITAAMAKLLGSRTSLTLYSQQKVYSNRDPSRKKKIMINKEGYLASDAIYIKWGIT